MDRGEDLHSTQGSEFTFHWTVVNFQMFGILEGKGLVSPKFTVPSLDNAEWFLKLVPNTDKIWSVKCFLLRTDSGPESIKISYSLSVGYPAYSVEAQTFGKNSCSIKPRIIDIYEFAYQMDQSFTKDVLIECRLWQIDELFRTRNAPTSPYPVFYSTRTVIPCEQINFFFPVKNFSTSSEGLLTSVCVDSAGNSYPKFACELWKKSCTTLGQVFYFKFLKPDPQPLMPLVVKYRIRIVDTLKKHRFLFRGRFVSSNNNYEPGLYIISTSMFEEKNKWLPDDVMTFFFEVAFSNYNAVSFSESTSYDSSATNLVPDASAANPVPSWGVYLDRKYNEHRFLFRLLVALVFVISVIIPYLLTDYSL